jgi:glycosyltransferase involved in cell wall biosynthesis
MRPRILTFLDHYRPGFRGGGPIPAVENLVDALRSDFDFRLVTRDRDLGDSAGYPGIRPDCWSEHAGIPVYYVSPSRLEQHTIRRLIGEIEPDAAYLNGFFSRFSLRALWLRRAGRIPALPFVVAPRGALMPASLAHKPLRKRVFLAALPRTGMLSGLTWHASSLNEAESVRALLRRLGEGDENVHVARELSPAAATDVASTPKQPGLLSVVFLSRIVGIKNLDGVLRCLRGVTARVDLAVYGPVEDAQYWEHCLALAAELPPQVRMEYRGELSPAAVRPTLAGADLLFLPSHDENHGHVIAEALSVGCPVLISDRTPWRELAAAGAGWDVPIDDVAGYRAAIEAAAALDEAAHAAMRTAAREFFNMATDRASAVAENRELFTLVTEQ